MFLSRKTPGDTRSGSLRQNIRDEFVEPWRRDQRGQRHRNIAKSGTSPSLAKSGTSPSQEDCQVRNIEQSSSEEHRQQVVRDTQILRALLEHLGGKKGLSFLVLILCK